MTDRKRIAVTGGGSFDPAELVRAMVELAESDRGLYRNVHPEESEELVRTRQGDAWTRRQSPPPDHVAAVSRAGSKGSSTMEQPTTRQATVAPSARPGKKLGATGELTTFWHVKQGHEQQLRAVLEQLDRAPLEIKASAGMLIGTLHDRRWVLFDDDTRMMFCTNYDGEWDPYIEAFAEHNAAAFEAIFAHIEGFPDGGMHDPGLLDYVTSHQVTAVEYMRFYEGTVHQIQRALALQKAFDALIDSPAFQQVVRDPAFKPLVDTPEFQAVLDHAAG